MIDLGVVNPGTTIRIPFNSFDKDDGSSITMTNFAAADILIYKDGGTTERASTAGFTATTDFDSKTGKHIAIIDLADDTTADFFKCGSEYLVGIDAVTVDAIVVGMWIARFRIGYESAWLNTSIATLASQTSFTLTSGPAEDDALNDCWAIIHDKASAVQKTWVQILDYTGSTKTVTLAAAPATTFTVAAIDNISVMFPSPVTAAFSARIPAVLAATGGMKADVMGFLGTAITETAGQIAAAVKKFFDKAAPTGTVNSIPDAVAGAASGLAIVGSSMVAGTVSDKTGYSLSAGGVTAVAAGVWDALTSGMVTVGSIGKKLADWVVGTIDTYTGNTKQTGDVYPKVDTEVATLVTGVADLQTQIGTAGAGLTGLGGMSATMKAQVEAEATDALNAYDPPTHAELVSEIDAVQTDVAAVQADTNDLQTRTVAALVGGRVPADTQAIGGTSTFGAEYGSVTLLEAMKLILSNANGRSSGLTSVTVLLKSYDGTTLETLTADATGNITGAVLGAIP